MFVPVRRKTVPVRIGACTVGGDHPEIDARGQRRPALGRQIPGEAHLSVMGVDRARAPEPVSWKTLLDARDHGIDSGAPVASHQRVDIARRLRPGADDEIAAARAVGLVPHGDVAVDQFGRIRHLVLHWQGTARGAWTR